MCFWNLFDFTNESFRRFYVICRFLWDFDRSMEISINNVSKYSTAFTSFIIIQLPLVSDYRRVNRLPAYVSVGALSLLLLYYCVCVYCYCYCLLIVCFVVVVVEQDRYENTFIEPPSHPALRYNSNIVWYVHVIV